MRALWLALALGLVGSGAAAADLSDPVWASAPSRDDWAKAYPAHAAQAGVSGAVKLRCAATAEGSLADCAVIQETPTGEGFGAAALSLAKAMELKPTGQDGKPVAGESVLVPVKFEPALLKPTVIVTPDWLRRPTNDEMLSYYPADAGSAQGRVILECVVTGRGLLDRCQAKDESPTGHGFANAALAMSQIFQMRPMTIDGLPVGGSAVSIPIAFMGGGPVEPGNRVRVLRAAPWLSAPTTDELAAAYPKSALGRIASAHVVLRCELRRDGTLADCETVIEKPDGHGFAQAAKRLAKAFKVNVGDKPGKLDDLRVDVPFDFEDPSVAHKAPEIYDPLWLRRPDPEAAIQLFPADALKAGVRAGRAKVVCDVAHDGFLKNCEVVEEDPGGLGFGRAALQMAAVMQMNPWTAQGTPVDGAKIELPIRLVMPEAPKPPTAAPAAPSH